MDVHVFGQLWMSPWGYTGNVPKHAAQHESMLKAVKSALLKERDVEYNVGQSATVLCKNSFELFMNPFVISRLSKKKKMKKSIFFIKNDV